MVDAGGTNTLVKLADLGQCMVFALTNSSVDSTETIPFDGPSNSPVKAEDQVIVLGMLNQTTESQSSGTALSCEYDETAMHFTVTEAGITDDVVTIVFMYIPSGKSGLFTDS